MEIMTMEPEVSEEQLKNKVREEIPNSDNNGDGLRLRLRVS